MLIFSHERLDGLLDVQLLLSTKHLWWCGGRKIGYRAASRCVDHCDGLLVVV